MSFLGAATGRRLTTKAIRRLLAQTERHEDANVRRTALLHQTLPDEIKALLAENSRGQVLTNADRLRRYIEAREEKFAYFAFRAALSLVLGEEVSPKMLARMYELDEVTFE